MRSVASNAEFVSQSVSQLMHPGAVYVVSITMRNTGPSTWVPDGEHPYWFGTQSPPDNSIWGFHRQRLPHAVEPGSDVTVRFSVTAPTTPGDYRFQWRMVQEGVEWFGERSPDLVVRVRPIDEAQAKALFRLRARNMLPLHAREPVTFTCSGPPEVSVIMVVHNNLALTLTALGSLRQNHPGDIELILVDSGSTDGTRHIGRYVRGARVLRFDTNIGYLRGCNAGLTQVSADAVLYLNNDVELARGAVPAALQRLHSDPEIGAVGGKVIRTHGFLQEAGSIIWRDGYTEGYLRDRSPLVPEANLVRDVDLCSAVFLLVRAQLLNQLEGFDATFAPCYYEDTDLCVRIRQAGYRVVFDPTVIVHHLEYGSAASDRDAAEGIAARHGIFVTKHAEWLRGQPVRRVDSVIEARSVRRGRQRILFVEDTIPLRMAGSGYTRSNDLISAMAELNRDVSVFPIATGHLDVTSVYADFPDDVEVLHDRAISDLPAFLAERKRYYDVIWIARTHNLDRLRPILLGREAAGETLPKLVLDTEAIAALRDAEKVKLLDPGTPFDTKAALAAEFENASMCQQIVSVSEPEANLLRSLGLPRVAVLGHMQETQPTPRPWKDRDGMLFVGAMHAMDSPNYDSLCWFVDEVLPCVEQKLRWRTRLTVVGHIAPGVDLSRFENHMRVSLLGAIWDLGALFDRHRVFVAPTRFASGIPYKVHTAAGYGLPIVATELLRRQLAWQAGSEILCAGASDPTGFAAQIVALHESEDLWQTIRQGALKRLEQENSRDRYIKALGSVLEADTRTSSDTGS